MSYQKKCVAAQIEIQHVVWFQNPFYRVDGRIYIIWAVCCRYWLWPGKEYIYIYIDYVKNFSPFDSHFQANESI